jgi:hypothetical protein
MTLHEGQLEVNIDIKYIHKAGDKYEMSMSLVVPRA